LDVVFLSPAYPPEMHQFTRGLAEVGARVHGVGDAPLAALPEAVRRHLTSYLHVPGIMDEDDVIDRVVAWLAGRRPDRVEGLWEVTTTLAARLRERLGVPGMSVDTVHGFRDKVEMKRRVAAAGIRVPRTARVRTADEMRAFGDQVGYPLIVKPVDGAGSASTHRLGSREELEAVLPQLGHLDEASLEEFVTGDELTFETVCIDGRPVYSSVSFYVPNVLDARRNEWISPIIFAKRDPGEPSVAAGVRMGHDVLGALGMGTGFTHMEWFRQADGSAVFGEIACRPPGANMVDLMNYAGDIDLFREWARAVVHGRFEPASHRRPWNAAIVFKRALGEGRIRAVEGLDAFLARHRPHVARVDLLPVGAPRRNWQQTFLSDGNLVVRHPDAAACLEIAKEAAATIRIYAG
jgi:biotin carboxylase